MAALLAALGEVGSPHDRLSSHLDASGNTIDANHCKKKLQKAYELLCDIWNNISIDNHTVTKRDNLSTDHNWVENHYAISKYCLRIAKRDDLFYCQALRADVQTIIKDRYLQGPRLMKRTAARGQQLANIGV